MHDFSALRLLYLGTQTGKAPLARAMSGAVTRPLLCNVVTRTSCRQSVIHVGKVVPNANQCLAHASPGVTLSAGARPLAVSFPRQF